MNIRVEGIDEAIRMLERNENKIQKAAEEIVRRLSLIGYDVAYTIMSGHIYSGETIGSLTIYEESPTRHVLVAESKAILFFEFGAGVQGVGHPLASEFGYGAGTYPGQTHAFDPNGWYYPTDDPALIVAYSKDGQGLGHSYGNPPYMPMYQASVKMKDDLLQVAKEVFNGD